MLELYPCLFRTPLQTPPAPPSPFRCRRYGPDLSDGATHMDDSEVNGGCGDNGVKGKHQLVHEKGAFWGRSLPLHRKLPFLHARSVRVCVRTCVRTFVRVCVCREFLDLNVPPTAQGHLRTNPTFYTGSKRSAHQTYS